jgi:hemerythrin
MLIDKTRFPRVALDSMNAVHDEEIDSLNRLAELVAQRRQGEDVEPVIAQLLEAFLPHVEAHFRAEEEQMQAAGFPPYPVHKQEHDRVLAELHERYAIWRNRGDSTELERYLLEDVPSWFEQHVASMDLVTARFLAGEISFPGA